MGFKPLLVISSLAAVVVLSAFILYYILGSGVDLGEYGLIGVFSASLLSHLTIVGKDMFIPVFLPLTRVYNPLLLGFSAGLGGAIGDTAAYYWGLGIGEALRGSRRVCGDDGGDDLISVWIRKYGYLAVLVVAISPLPDAPIVLLAGSARFPVLKLLAIEVFGKTVWYSAGAFLGGVVFEHLTLTLGDVSSSILILVISVVLCVVASSDRVRGLLLRLVESIYSALSRV